MRVQDGWAMQTLLTPLGDGRLSLLFRERGCNTLHDASRLLAAMPYARPATSGNRPCIDRGARDLFEQTRTVCVHLS